MSRRPIITPRNSLAIIGQSRLCKRIQRDYAVFKQHGQLPCPYFLVGGSGCGKNHVTMAMAKQFDLAYHLIDGVQLAKAEDLRTALKSVVFPSLLHLDEAHAFEPRAQEMLFQIFDTGAIIEKDGTRIALPQLIIVATTNRPGSLREALISRLGSAIHLERYTESDIAEMIGQAACAKSVVISGHARNLLAKFSRGNPRRALTLLWDARASALVNLPVGNLPEITVQAVREALQLRGIDQDGFDFVQRDILTQLVESNGMFSAADLQAMAGYDATHVRNEIIGPLVHRGFVRHATFGWCATDAGKQWIRNQVNEETLESLTIEEDLGEEAPPQEKKS